MAHEIKYDRSIGPVTVNSGSDATTSTISITSETAPTDFSAVTYFNFIIQVSSPGDTSPTTAATCTDTQASTYTLVKEVLFGGYALDIFSRAATAPAATSTVTTSHQPSKHRILVNDEWYNISNFEKISSAYSSTANAQIDLGEFKSGQKDWLVYAVAAIGGSSHGDSISIPDDWHLLHDYGTNYGDGQDVRMVVCYQIAKKRKKVDFKPVISNPRVWGAVMFSYKEKL